MDWFLVLGVVGAIWAVVVLTWRRGEGGAREAPSRVLVEAGARPRTGTQALIYGYGEDDVMPGAAARMTPRPVGRGASKTAEPGFPPVARVAQDHDGGQGDLAGRGPAGRSAARERDGVAARPSAEPEASGPAGQASVVAPEGIGEGNGRISAMDSGAAPARGAAAEAAAMRAPERRAEHLPVRISDYQPGEQVVIRYMPTHREAPAPRLTAHQVGEDVELRLSGTTVAILEHQRARQLIDEKLLHLSRDEPELETASSLT